MRMGALAWMLRLNSCWRLEIIAQVIRPGKTIELIESENAAQGKTCMWHALGA